MHIAIAGNIGAGKTTLTRMLSEHYKWEAHFENASHNPYLNDFYQDMKRWSFNLQIYFLNHRFNQIEEIRDQKKTIIQDRTIYEDGHIFAPNLHEMGLMSSRDFENYFSLFSTIEPHIEAPDLLIYLKASTKTLFEHIMERGREYEGAISIDYLKRLNERYESWVSGYNKGKLLIIDVDTNQFANDKEDFGYVIQKVDAEINGLF